MFTSEELKIINDALDLATASSKRMQVSKPKFANIFLLEQTEIAALKIKLNTPVKNK